MPTTVTTFTDVIEAVIREVKNSNMSDEAKKIVESTVRLHYQIYPNSIVAEKSKGATT